MAEFRVFDGTCASPVATSLVTLAWAEGYMVERGAVSADWAAAGDEQKQGALRLATLVVESMNFIGERLTEFQALSWPRNLGGSETSQVVTITGGPAADTLQFDSLTENTAYPSGFFSGGSVYFHESGKNYNEAYTISEFDFTTGNVKAVTDFTDIMEPGEYVTLTSPVHDDVRAAIVEMAVTSIEQSSVDIDPNIKREKLATAEFEYFDRMGSGSSLYDITPAAQKLLEKYIIRMRSMYKSQTNRNFR